jgi:Serine/threonine protein kinase
MDREEWTLGEKLGAGGMGAVYLASSPTRSGVVKLVGKEPGADRELLFVNLAGRPNIVPIIDAGETGDQWALAMPRAERSLREHLGRLDGPLPLPETIAILRDIATGIANLRGEVVHRDIKPENILLLDGHWCLSDFGIARYAEAATAPDTRKRFLSAPYAAPEQWKWERATPQTDVYATGVIGFELLTGCWPFRGPDFRKQHVEGEFPRHGQAPSQVMTLIETCLYKAPETRPSPGELVAQLNRLSPAPPSEGIAKLRLADAREVGRRFEQARRRSAALSESERRTALLHAAERGLELIAAGLREAITEAAPSATEIGGPGAGWEIRLGDAIIHCAPPVPVPGTDVWHSAAPAFDVVCCSRLSVRHDPDPTGYTGRSHSLWFCDAQKAGAFRWFETAFMNAPDMMPSIAPETRRDPEPLSDSGTNVRFGFVTRAEVPSALAPGAVAGAALIRSRSSAVRVAWPFTPLDVTDLTGFIDRWSGWFGLAASGELTRPESLPEREPAGSWRR